MGVQIPPGPSISRASGEGVRWLATMVVAQESIVGIDFERLAFSDLIVVIVGNRILKGSVGVHQHSNLHMGTVTDVPMFF